MVFGGILSLASWCKRSLEFLAIVTSAFGSWLLMMVVCQNFVVFIVSYYLGLRNAITSYDIFHYIPSNVRKVVLTFYTINDFT